MKLNNLKKQAGLTLIEVTLVIAVLLGLISVLFIGVSAYREGSNRARCILNITNVQKAARSYQNLFELAGPVGEEAGDPLASTLIMGEGRMIDTPPTCPSGGTYTFATTVPRIGDTYATCSLAESQDHEPANTDGW